MVKTSPWRTLNFSVWQLLAEPCRYILERKHKMSHLMTKPTKWPVRPAKTEISLGIHTVWWVFDACLKKQWVLSYPLSAQRRLWSDWADAQADLNLCWVHKSFCWFCHAAAQNLYPDMVWNIRQTFKNFEHQKRKNNLNLFSLLTIEAKGSNKFWLLPS